MPELPEVETIKRRLLDVLPGRVIQSISVHHQKSIVGSIEDLIGLEVSKVARRAKVLSIGFTNSSLELLTHLKMTGQLVFIDKKKRVGGGHPTADWTQNLPSKHTRISYTFQDGSMLHFNDMRLFGWMKVMHVKEAQNEFAKFGPDIIDPALTTEYVVAKLKTKSIAIKVVLLDSSIVAGLGNIYVCDALNLARISPFRPAKSLSFDEVERLLACSQEVVNRGIELQGTTFDGKYVTVDGMAGGYQEEVLVYGRKGEPCYNCASLISKEKLAGRGTYFCEVCQV